MVLDGIGNVVAVGVDHDARDRPAELALGLLAGVRASLLDGAGDGDLPYRRLIVNDYIVDETATRLKKQASMRNAASFLTTLDESTLYQFEGVSADVFDAAKTMFVEWTDLDASFTDFVVAAHMVELEVDHILTYDRHYDAFDVTTLPYRSQI
ncbi:type II toxin-antitoxin system VapC family toxin [Haloferax mediterranei ATCC 33500]|nr:type II toxin-antitoxin system VapC family toxin [Haloferax mediterranei]MDX5989731.1 type II toxin-antitoxin system VapC family toxin [Haloferax mediterranei ATCC 33500]